MADHTELVSEISYVEKMSTQDRLKHAKKRRSQQLKKLMQFEKHLEKENAKKRKSGAAVVAPPTSKRSERRIQFINNVILLEAAARNDIDEVQDLLKRQVDPDMTNEDGLTALHQCCIDDNEEMLRLLLNYGASVNARDSELWTPLHAAATCGHVHLCKILIDAGAELLTVNADGNMPYDICEDDETLDYVETEMANQGVTQEQIDETRLVTEKEMLTDIKKHHQDGRPLDFRSEHGATPLHIAAANGYIHVAEFLLENNVRVNPQDEDLWQPIHAAACWCQQEILEMLVRNGANLDSKTRTGETPFDICEDPELKQKILDMKDEIEVKQATKKNDQILRRRSYSRRSCDPVMLFPRLPEHHPYLLGNSASSLYSSNTSLGDKHPLSASIRRSSMREKNLMSLKEAKEEATRFDVQKNLHNEDEEENQDSNHHHIQGHLHSDEKIQEQVEPEQMEDEHEWQVSDRDENNHKENVPTTNIDDIVIDVDMSVPPHVMKVKRNDAENTEPSTKVTKQPLKESGNIRVIVSDSNGTDINNSHSVQNSAAHTNNHSKDDSNDNSNNKTVHAQDSAQNQSKTSDPDIVQSASGNKQTYDSSSLGRPDRINQSSGGPINVRTGKEANSQLRYPTGGKTGTLSDLKKIRSEKYNSLRLKEDSDLDVQLQTMFLESTTKPSSKGAAPPPPVASRSSSTSSNVAHKVQAPAHHNNNTPIHPSNELQLKKFTAPRSTQIIGNDEPKHRCCTIM